MTDGRDMQAVTAESFAIVGSDLRLSILRSLWDADQPLSFSDLQAAAGVRDSTQFNYHLKKLIPQFVRKTTDGYRLAWPGKYVVRAIVAGTLVGDRMEAFPAGGACLDCAADLVASYDGDRLTVDCPECDRLYSTWPFPPGGLVDRDSESLLDAYDRWVRHEFGLGVQGVCSDCGGHVDRLLSMPAEAEDLLCSLLKTGRPDDVESETDTQPAHDPAEATEGTDSAPVRAQYQCRRCRKRATAHPGMVLLTEPSVRDFYRDHGQSVETVRYWTLPWAVDDKLVEPLEHEPLRVQVRISLGTETLTATVDESLTVVDTTRVHGQ